MTQPVPNSAFSYYPIISPHPIPTRAMLAKNKPTLKTIDLMWRLFNAWPSNGPRLEKTKAATSRMDTRREGRVILPPRAEFASTADYYEAALHLSLAQYRFRTYMKPGSHFRAVHMVLAAMSAKK